MGGAVDDEAPETVVDIGTSEDRGIMVDMQQSTGQCQPDIGNERIGEGTHDSVQEVEDMSVPVLPVPSGADLPDVERPKRNRRPNVKYSSEDYDLSAISAVKKGLCLSRLYVNQCQPRSRGRYQEKSRRL